MLWLNNGQSFSFFGMDRRQDFIERTSVFLTEAVLIGPHRRGEDRRAGVFLGHQQLQILPGDGQVDNFLQLIQRLRGEIVELQSGV